MQLYMIQSSTFSTPLQSFSFQKKTFIFEIQIFFSWMSDSLYGIMNLIVTIAVKYSETFCISQESKHREIIIMFDLSVKKNRKFINIQCNVHSPTGKLTPLNNTSVFEFKTLYLTKKNQITAKTLCYKITWSRTVHSWVLTKWFYLK